MNQTLIGYFEDSDAVTRARQALRQAGFADGDVILQAGDNAGAPSVIGASTAATTAILGSTGATGTDAADSKHAGVGGWVKSLFGLDDKANVNYDSEAVGRGNYLLVVNASGDDELQRAEAILRACGADNLGTRAQP